MEGNKEDHSAKMSRAMRTVQGSHVFLFGRFYWSKDLAAYNCKKVEVFYGPDSDAVQIYFQGKFIATAKP